MGQSIDIGFYLRLRKALFMLYLICFIPPAVYGLVASDGLHFAMIVSLSFSALLCGFLASKLYSNHIIYCEVNSAIEEQEDH